MQVTEVETKNINFVTENGHGLDMDSYARCLLFELLLHSYSTLCISIDRARIGG